MAYKDPEKQREYQRTWKNARREKWFQGKTCVDCGGTDRLELDHVDPRQKVSHNIWSWSWARIEEESSKCEVRCRPCHMVKTWTKDGRARAEHGSHSMYTGPEKCRCAECKLAHTQLAAASRAAGKKW